MCMEKKRKAREGRRLKSNYPKKNNKRKLKCVKKERAK